jgi:hypothetical protein
MDPGDIEPEVEVLPKLLLRHQVFQIPVGRRDDSDIQGNTSLAPQRIDLFALDHPKDLRLSIRAHIPDLVKKNGPAIRELKLTRIRGMRSSEGAFLIAK